MTTMACQRHIISRIKTNSEKGKSLTKHSLNGENSDLGFFKSFYVNNIQCMIAKDQKNITLQR